MILSCLLHLGPSEHAKTIFQSIFFGNTFLKTAPLQIMLDMAPSECFSAVLVVACSSSEASENQLMLPYTHVGPATLQIAFQMAPM